MAKQAKLYNLEQGTGDNKKVVPVSTKTTTQAYFKRLVEDYRAIGVLDSRDVKIVPVVPLFS